MSEPTFMPLVQGWARVARARDNSDEELFYALMYLGEMAVKIAVLGVVSCVGDDRERSRYRLHWALARADSLGKWADALEEALSGPAASRLREAAYPLQRELMARVSGSGWQGRGVRLLYEAAGCFGPVDQAPAKADGRRWIRAFVQLRNRTRGHGAPPPAALSAACGPLESAIREFTTGFGLFSGCEWVHLRRNLSGKYNVARLTATSASFDHLRSAPTEALANGVYVWVGGPVRVELVECRPDVPDFFIANGNFTDRSFEALSYATGATVSCDAGPYQAPVGPLPPSETAGATSLEVQGQCLGNLPALPAGFVARASLQEELYQRLTEDNHPIITLHGRGGTGKTSLALEVLHRIAREGLFDLVLWFSARDLDLLPEGPKRVAPEVLDVRQLAEEFARLLGGTAVIRNAPWRGSCAARRRAP